MHDLFAEFPQAIAATREIADRCEAGIALGNRYLPVVPAGRRTRPSRCTFRRLCEEGIARLYPAVTPEIRDAARARDRGHHRDEVRRLLPDRLGLHPLRARARDPGRPGPRLGGRLARRLRARDHADRPAQVRPAVRALPELRAHLDARHRHRLLQGAARGGHRRTSRTSTAPTASRRSSRSAR